MKLGDHFRVLLVDLEARNSELVYFGERQKLLGGSGLAAALFERYGLPGVPASDPAQPLIFAIGSLTGLYPLMSKVVCGFKSPYHEQYAESHAGGRLALALRFAGYDALVIRGRAATPSCLVVGPGPRVSVDDVHYLWGMDAFAAGKMLRKVYPGHSGHRSTLRIGPAGENGLAYACINVDTYRHFGRLGAGTVMGAKLLKAVVVRGEGALELPDPKGHAECFRRIYRQVNDTNLLHKYHDLGTAENLASLNALRALPWRNLQQTSDPAIDGVSGERFARDALLRQVACAGCPVGCIHVGMLRQQYAAESHYQYREVGYDYEPIFAGGTMLGLTSTADILSLLDEVEKQGMDIMSAGVALAWATEAFEKGLIGETQTLAPLVFGQVEGYRKAVHWLGQARNEFYQRLGQGALKAAGHYGGEDFACVLGQEMAGYATGEVFFTSQALGFRHSHLDAAGYSFDQTQKEKDVEKAVDFLVRDERERCLLTSCVGCLFSRKVYGAEVLADCLTAVGLGDAADRQAEIAERVQRLRWRVRFATGYDPEGIRLPKRFQEVVNWKGPMDAGYLDALRLRYAEAIRGLAG